MKLSWFSLLITLFVLMGCSSPDEHADHDHDSSPTFSEIALDGRQLNVVATTSLIGDVVSNIGGEHINLTTLIDANQDPHSYEATPSDLIALEEADVIFINGWDLEEQLAANIEENYADKYAVISAEIEPLELSGADEHDEHHEEGEADEHHEEGEADEHHEEGEADGHDEHGHGSIDPHVWFSIANVKLWAEYSAEILAIVDPANAAAYTENATLYQSQLSELETEVDALLEQLPVERRQLVTNHEALGYFAHDYDFTLAGTVIPAASTSAEPSASDLAALIDTMREASICAVFTDTSAATSLADTVASELDNCTNVQVLPLYTESLGEGAADSYIGLYRINVETIVSGLK